MSQTNTELSQISNLSDLLSASDVETLIQETGIEEQVNYLLTDNDNEAPKEENKYKIIAMTNNLGDTTTEILKFPPAQYLSTNEDADYVGPFNFKVIIENATNPNQKTPWEYSAKLNKVFAPLNVKLPIGFKIDNCPKNIFFVRATPYFSQSQYFKDLVKRCVVHQLPQDHSNIGLDKHVHQHILRCENKETRYYGNYEKNERLSCVFPLEKVQTGAECVKEFFSFVCCNSCPTGINRRPFNVFFTLEDENGKIYGRKLLAVKVCACTKRDREKEEKDFEVSQEKKKRKVAYMKEDAKTDDAKVYHLSVDIFGKQNFIHDLKNIRNHASFCMLNLKEGEPNPYKNTYTTVCKMLEKVSKE